MKNYPLLFFIFFCHLLTLGQNQKTFNDPELEQGQYSGFVISSKADTAFGKILLKEEEGTGNLQILVRFTSLKGEEYLFKPGAIKGFSVFASPDTLCFESVPNSFNAEIAMGGLLAANEGIRSDSFFLEKLCSGYYNLYYIRDARIQGTHFSYYYNGHGGIDSKMRDEDEGQVTKQNGLSGFPQNYYCVKRTDGPLLVINPKKGGAFFMDNSELIEKISKGTYQYNDMLQIVTEYNEWKAKRLSAPVRY
jgi:hypothetical protein